MIDDHQNSERIQNFFKAHKVKINLERNYGLISRYFSYVDKIRVSGLTKYFKMFASESISSYLQIYQKTKEKFQNLNWKDVVDNPEILRIVIDEIQLRSEQLNFTERQIFGFVANFMKNFYLKGRNEMVMIEETLANHYNFSNMGIGAKFLVTNQNSLLISEIITFMLEAVIFNLKYSYTDSPNISLDFSFNKLKKHGMTPFRCILEKDSLFKIKYLNFARCHLGNEGTASLGKILTKSTYLTHLILKSNEVSDEGVKLLSEGLINHPTLKELDLSNNEISDGGAKYLGIVIEKNNILRKLNLFNNSINENGGRYLFEALTRNPLNSIEYLNIGINQVGAEGVKILAQFLKMKLIQKGGNPSGLMNGHPNRSSENISVSTNETKNFLSLSALEASNCVRSLNETISVDQSLHNNYFNINMQDNNPFGTISSITHAQDNGMMTFVCTHNEGGDNFTCDLFKTGEEEDKVERMENLNLTTESYLVNDQERDCTDFEAVISRNLLSRKNSLVRQDEVIAPSQLLDFSQIWGKHKENPIPNEELIQQERTQHPICNNSSNPKIVSPVLYKNFLKMKYLNLSKNGLTDFEMLYISNSLKNNFTLETLILAQNKLTYHSCKSLCENLCQNSYSALKNLQLNENMINSDGLRYLSQLLTFNSSIETLNLAHNKIVGNEGLKPLSDCICKNKTLLTLELQYNEMGNIGCYYLAGGLKSNNTLKTLNLFANKITHEGAKYISQAIFSNKLTNLSTLFFGCNQISDKGAGYFSYLFSRKGTLISINQLQILDLSQNRIAFHGARQIAEALLTNDSLLILDLKENEISMDGIKMIFEAFQKNPVIKKLNLNHNNKYGTGGYSNKLNSDFIFTKQ